ncbi:nitroreductase family protein [Chloroflexota bacterium]
MEFFQVLKERQSIREFAPNAIEDSNLEEILRAANMAPSAGNLQAYEIYVVTKSNYKSALSKAALDQPFIASAPVVLVFCAYPARSEYKYGRRGRHLYAIQDATIACTFAMLAATALGLASVWVGAFNESAVHQVIGAPSGNVPVAILPIGHGAERPPGNSRRSLDDLVHVI